MQRILTVTMNPAVDKSAVVQDVMPEHKLRCRDPRREAGGGGINVSRAIQELGGESTALFPAGGPTGRMLVELLDDVGVEQLDISTYAWTRENLTVFESSTEQQYRFGMPGPTLSEAEWRACRERIDQVDPAPAYLVASGSLPQGVPEDFYGRMAQAAKRRGARLLLDTSGGPLQRAAEEGVFLLKPNAREFAALTGESFESEEQQERLARRLVAQGACEVLVLSLGAAGVLLATRERLDRVRSPAVPIRSKVGAGDSMVAAIVLGLARGMDTHQAVCFGVAAGAAAVMTPGTELCRREDVERLHARLTGCSES